MKAFRRIGSSPRSRQPAAAPAAPAPAPRPAAPTQMPLRAGRKAPSAIALDPWRAADPMAR
jgi:hypothetical protein